MKFLTTLTVAATGAFAKPITAPRTAGPFLNDVRIAGFSVLAHPAQRAYSYSFTVGSVEGEFNPVPRGRCGAWRGDYNEPDRIPSVFQGDCVDLAPDGVRWHWSNTRQDNGDYRFVIWLRVDADTTVTYCHKFPAKDWVVEEDGLEHYVGPADVKGSIDDCVGWTPGWAHP